MTKFQICGRSFRQGCQKQSPRDQREAGETFFGRGDNFISFDAFSEEILISKKLQFRQ